MFLSVISAPIANSLSASETTPCSVTSSVSNGVKEKASNDKKPTNTNKSNFNLNIIFVLNYVGTKIFFIIPKEVWFVLTNHDKKINQKLFIVSLMYRNSCCLFF